MDQPIRILVIDDHPLMRDGIALLLNQQPDMKVVGEAGDGAEALIQFRGLRPDVILVDLQMPNMDGHEFARTVHAEDPAAKMIMLTTFRGDMHVFHAFAAGVSGYMLKDMMRKDLVNMVRDVFSGRRVLSTEIAGDVMSHLSGQRLSEREVEILRLVALGNSNKAVGKILTLGEATVKTHMRSIMSKLDANDRTHAVTIALKRGIITID
jgi:DNA-binding NarL/FixJ family response regulator